MRAHRPSSSSATSPPPGAMPSLAPMDAPSPLHPGGEGRHAAYAKARQTPPTRANLFQSVQTCSKRARLRRTGAKQTQTRRPALAGRLPATSSVESRRRASCQNPPQPAQTCHTPARRRKTKPEKCNPVQPHATRTKMQNEAKCHSVTPSPPPPPRCAKFPNEPTAPVTPRPSSPLRALRVLRGSILPPPAQIEPTPTPPPAPAPSPPPPP
jgi:hypothetical protein